MPNGLKTILLIGLGVLTGLLLLPTQGANAQQDQYADFLRTIEERCEVEVFVEVDVEVFHDVGWFSRNEYGYGEANGVSYGQISCN